MASAPPLVKKTFSKPSGAMPETSSAACARCSLANCGATVHSRSACSLIAATTRGCWWPMLEDQLAGEVEVAAVLVVPHVRPLGRGDYHRADLGLGGPGVED